MTIQLMGLVKIHAPAAETAPTDFWLQNYCVNIETPISAPKRHYHNHLTSVNGHLCVDFPFKIGMF